MSDEHPHLPLYINYALELDRLEALEFGRVADGTPSEWWEGVSEQFGYFRPPGSKEPAGFLVRGLVGFDPHSAEVNRIWEEPHFDAPVLGLSAASAGEIIVAAHVHFDRRPSVNRLAFDAAVSAAGDPENAVPRWRACLESGDSMAHFALGYTLYEQGSYHDAYRHLRYYVGIAPAHPWNWVWYGKAAAAIGEITEARTAYERAIGLEAETDEETDATELLAALD